MEKFQEKENFFQNITVLTLDSSKKKMSNLLECLFRLNSSQAIRMNFSLRKSFSIKYLNTQPVIKLKKKL